MKLKLIPIILLTISVVSCNTQKKIVTDADTKSDSEMEVQTGLMDTQWVLTELEGAKVDTDQAYDKTVRFTLNSEDNTMNGYFGCNSGFGSFSLEDGNRIRFSNIGTTRMACPDMAIDEAQVLEVFNLADNYTFNGNTLALNVGRRAPLAVFTKVEAHVNPIVEKYWKLKTLEGKEIKMGEHQEREIYFMLKTDEKRVTGFAGCNTFGGTYTLEEGNRIKFTQMMSTMMACPEVDVNEVEFLRIFELVDNYTIDGDTLMLNVGRRAPLAVFEAIYLD